MTHGAYPQCGNEQTFVHAVGNSVTQMEESMDESERLFDEVNPTSLTKALSFFKWVRARFRLVDEIVSFS